MSKVITTPEVYKLGLFTTRNSMKVNSCLIQMCFTNTKHCTAPWMRQKPTLSGVVLLALKFILEQITMMAHPQEQFSPNNLMTTTFTVK